MPDATPAYEGPDRRHAERTATAIAITVREAGRNQLPARLASLSTKGCDVTGISLGKGEGLVWIRLPGIESQPARRIWSTTGASGFAFEHALHPAVVGRFTGTQGSPAYHPGTAPQPSVAHEDLSPASRREQILGGLAQVPRGLLSAKREHDTKATLGGLVRRHSARVVDQRLEPRFPPPAEATLGFRAGGEPAAVNDLSSSGVQLGTAIKGGIGARVDVAFAGYPPLAGSIVWVRAGATGVRLPAQSLDLFDGA